MMGLTSKLDTAVQRCIDDHLDLIDEMLRGSGMSRSERQSILDDVQTQVLDMLAARTEGEPTVEDVRAVIAELDPPEYYAQENGVSAESSVKPETVRRISKLAVAGVFWALFFVPSILLCLLFRSTQAVVTMPEYAFIITVLSLGLTAPLGTTALGLISISQIRHSGRPLYGLGLSVADALFGPFVLLYGVSLGIVMLPVTMFHSFLDIPVRVIPLLAILVWGILAFFLARRAWRAANRPGDKT